MKNKPKLLTLIETVLVFVLAFSITFFDVFYSFDSLLQDKIYQSPRGINNKIKIIAIDDRTLQEIGPFGTWSRGVYAEVIEKLGDSPAVIAMDIMIFGNMDEEGDEALKKACEENDRVVSGAFVNYNSAYKTDEKGKPYIDHFNVESIEQPIIEDYVKTGFVNAAPDDDGIVRSTMLTEEYAQ